MKTAATLVLFTIFINAFVSAQTLYFPPVSGSNWETISPSELGWCSNRIDSLYQFLDSNNTKSFILLKDGKIVLEKYFGTHTASDYWYWASAGKSLTAFLVGLAQQDGYLSILDTSSKYLGEGWTTCPIDKEEKITIRHQLTMTSGLDDGVADPYCTNDTSLKYLADAGSRWAYHNAPYTLLDSVLHSATGMTISDYLVQKLSAITGISGLYYPIDFNNVFFSNARSMARFGLLVLNKGKWNQTPILTDTAYFHDMINTSQNLNLSYGYLWWLNGKASFMVPYSQLNFPGSFSPSAPDDMFAALGKNGQFINVVPSQNMVWIRMGDIPQSVDVPFLLNESIWQYINQLSCVGLDDLSTSLTIDVFPNPCAEKVKIQSSETISSLAFFSSAGSQIAVFYPNSSSFYIDLESNIEQGMIMMIGKTDKGEHFSQWIQKM